MIILYVYYSNYDITLIVYSNLTLTGHTMTSTLL